MPADTTISPARTEFLQLAATHSLVPVYRTLTADLETPVSAFLRLAADEPHATTGLVADHRAETGEVRQRVDGAHQAFAGEGQGTKIPSRRNSVSMSSLTLSQESLCFDP